VLREIAWLSGAGAVLGLVVATLATRLLRTMLYGVDPLDATTLAAAAVVVAAPPGDARRRSDGAARLNTDVTPRAVPRSAPRASRGAPAPTTPASPPA